MVVKQHRTKHCNTSYTKAGAYFLRFAQADCHQQLCTGRKFKQKKLTGTFMQRHISLQLLNANLAKSLLEGATEVQTRIIPYH